MKRLSIASGFVLVSALPMFANTWYVGGSGSDFLEIQPAIDAAEDGDVILVRPGAYQVFTLRKGVIIRASADWFEVYDQYDRVIVEGISAAQRAGVSGMAAGVPLSISNCLGEVVLERLVFNGGYSCGNRLRIENCSNLIISGFFMLEPYCWGSPAGEVVIKSSSVSIDSGEIYGSDAGGQGNGGNGLPGAPGIVIKESRLVLSRTKVVGGDGSDGEWYTDGTGDGGDGGLGIQSSNSEVILIGPSSVVAGGDGGDAAEDWGYYSGYPGVGGDGFSYDSATASRTSFEGGDGGMPYGDDGQPWEGDVIFIDQFPLLWTGTDLHPGQDFKVLVDLVEAGTVIMLLSVRHGFVDIPGNPGPPLQCLPGEWFVAFSAGHVDAGTSLLLTLTLYDDPALRGFPLAIQSAVLTEAGAAWLSNSVTRVIGE